MNSILTLNKLQLKRHIIIWAIVIVYLNLNSILPGSLKAKIIGSAIEDINYIFVFYSISIFILPNYWANKKFIVLGVALLFCYCIFSCVAYLNYFKIIPFLGGRVFYLDYSFAFLLVDNLFYFFLFGIAGFASFFHRYSINHLEILSNREKTFLRKEMTYIKDKFNSQITFNFLNHCYKAIGNEESDVAISIKLFSETLKYTFETKPEEKVSLDKEILFIENFIKLQKLLSEKVYVVFEIDIKYHFEIYPRILITYVENAFKHGIFNDPDFPICISFTTNDSCLNFQVVNKINLKKTTINSTHTGLENAKQILNVHYNSDYILTNEKIDSIYKVDLMIKLK